jgi:hypothetical protein
MADRYSIEGAGVYYQTYPDIFFRDTRLEYSGSDPIYVGKHKSMGASTANTNWFIQKLTYTSGLVTRIQIAQGAWDNRSSLF